MAYGLFLLFNTTADRTLRGRHQICRARLSLFITQGRFTRGLTFISKTRPFGRRAKSHDGFCQCGTGLTSLIERYRVLRPCNFNLVRPHDDLICLHRHLTSSRFADVPGIRNHPLDFAGILRSPTSKIGGFIKSLVEFNRGVAERSGGRVQFSPFIFVLLETCSIGSRSLCRSRCGLSLGCF